MDRSDENLLLRWSRRKTQARQAEAKEPVPPKPVAAELEQPVVAAAAAPSETEKPVEPQANPEAPVRVEDLPDIETLTYESDFSIFLREGVPELIRKQALRKLWISNPILANLDGLNGYDPMHMKFLEPLEGAAEPLAEVGRSLRDKIMEDKRARNDRPRGPRQSAGERERHSRAAARPAAENETDKPAGDRAASTGSKSDDPEPR